MKPEEELFQIRHTLFRLALGILGNKEDAEDALADFYLHVRERRNQFRAYDNLRGALVRSLRNHCLNTLKVSKKRKLTDHLPEDIPENAEDDQLTQNKYFLVEQIIEDLPEKQRTLIQLRMVEGYSMKEIAEIMEEKVNTIEVSISRIRKKIRESYDERA